MRQSWFAALLIAVIPAVSSSQTLAPSPTALSAVQLANMEPFEGKLVSVSDAVRHSDSPQVFTIGAGKEVHVVIPMPAVAPADVADTVATTGFVRRFAVSDFERDYSWFRRGDYPDLKTGDWIIVATSVRTSGGTELVPPATISETSPQGKTSK